MDGYDYRKGAGASNAPQLTGYTTQKPPGYPAPPPPYNRPGTSMGQPPPFYPRIAQPVGPSPVNRPPPSVPSTPATQGGGIRVAIKPEYLLANAVQLQPPAEEVPRSLFQFDFEFERRLLADLEGDGTGWSRSSEGTRQANGDDSTLVPPVVPVVEDPVVAKYVAMGLNKDAVVMAVATFGDSQNKVVDFCPPYMLLVEMGFPSEVVAGVLATHDNDKDKAIAHFVPSG